MNLPGLRRLGPRGSGVAGRGLDAFKTSGVMQGARGTFHLTGAAAVVYLRHRLVFQVRGFPLTVLG